MRTNIYMYPNSRFLLNVDLVWSSVFFTELVPSLNTSKLDLTWLSSLNTSKLDSTFLSSPPPKKKKQSCSSPQWLKNGFTVRRHCPPWFKLNSRREQNDQNNSFCTSMNIQITLRKKKKNDDQITKQKSCHKSIQSYGNGNPIHRPSKKIPSKWQKITH